MANNKKEEVDWVKVAEGTVAAAEAAIELIKAFGKGNSNKK